VQSVAVVAEVALLLYISDMFLKRFCIVEYYSHIKSNAYSFIGWYGAKTASYQNLSVVKNGPLI